jgi:hypothetical protein
MTERSNAWTNFAHLNSEIVGINPTGSMAVCVHLFRVCVVLYSVPALNQVDAPSKEAYNLCIVIQSI